MYNIEVPKTVNQMTTFYHHLRIWQSNEEASLNSECGRKSFYCILYLSFSISLFVGGYQSEIPEERILLVSLGLQTLIVLTRLVYFLLKESDILQFTNEMGVHTINDREKFLLVSKKLKRLMSLSRFVVGMVFGAELVVLFFPIFTNKLLLNISFPFKRSKIGFWVTYVFETLQCLLTTTIISTNVHLWFIMMSCSIRYEILGYQFRNCGLIRTTRTTVQHQQDFSFSPRRDFVALIRSHRSIKGYTPAAMEDKTLNNFTFLIREIDRFRLCFIYLFMAQIVTSSALICCVIYVLAFSNHEDLLSTAYIIIFSTYNIFDIFMVSYLGNEIKLKSDGLSYCLYESDWIDQSKVTKQNMIIMFEVLKKNHELVICKLYPLTLETFTQILKLSYSMFNLLQNFK